MWNTIFIFRILTRSDPVVLLCHPTPTCKACGKKGHSKKTCEWDKLRQRHGSLTREEQLFVNLLADEEIESLSSV